MKLKINELSKVLGVTSMTLRRYEQHGYITPERDASDYRWYNDRDIIKMVQIRLLRKCGFSHQDISEFMGSSVEKIREVSVKRLDEIDAEMKRLKYLRHWLKDNIQLIDNIAQIGDGFVHMDCPPLRYVIYGTHIQLYKEKERLKTVNDFMYVVEEVQPMYILKNNDIFSDEPIPYRGLAVKEMDIPRLGIEEIMENDKFIEIYPKMPCVYGIIACEKTEESQFKAFKDFRIRLEEYFDEKGLEVAGDVMGFILGVLGEGEYYMMCVPYRERTSAEN